MPKKAFLLIAMTPDERAEHMINTPLLATAHDTAATSGQSEVPDIQDEVDYHYSCFVPIRSDVANEFSEATSSANQGLGELRIVELNGSRPHPIDHGPCHNFLEVSFTRSW